MTNEQREAIEYIQKQIDYFKEQIKFIEAVDCDYYEEEYELYKNRIKQFSTVLSLIKEQEKQIDLMAEYIDEIDVSEDICEGKTMCDENCKDCVKQYFAGLVEKE